MQAARRSPPGIAATALAAAVALALGGCERPPMVPEIRRDVVGGEDGFRSGMPTSNNPPVP